jgi:hemolysin activation/secretion protein
LRRLAGRRDVVVAALIAGLFSGAALAQVVPPSEQPGRERERFVEPPAARAQPGGPSVTLPSTTAPAGAEKITVVIRRIEVTGSTVYREADFAPLYADLVGREVPLTAIYELAQRITTKYGADGYVLSRAIVPPQNLGRGGAVVRIQVVEGYVDKVVWPANVARYRDFFTYYAEKITSDRPTNIRTLERYLLLMTDLPGFKVSTALKPSATNPNASTLFVEVTEKTLDVMGRVDNRGTHARGPLQYQTSATVNNIIGAHEAFTVTYAGAFQPKEMQYVAAAYRQVLTAEGLTFFANASYGPGRPGTAVLELLDYKTRSTGVEAGLSYPVIRTREKNLTLTALGFATNDESDILGAPFTRDRIRGMRLKADGDFADPLLGINQVNLTYSQGFNGFGAAGDSTNAGRPDFAKFEGTYSRLQPLPANFSFLFAAHGQYAVDPLLVSEQCGHGGRFFGRGFDPSQLLGDHCFQLIGELRYDLPALLAALPRTQLYGYADQGWLFNRQPALGTPKESQATSLGAGVRLATVKDLFAADLSVAKAVEGPRDDWRFFFSLTAKN